MLTLAAFIVGGCLGFVFAALMLAAKDKNEEESLSDWIDYKCKLSTMKECDNSCCWTCLGASECKYACKGNPSECGQSIISMR